jgi:hypothetical protein
MPRNPATTADNNQPPLPPIEKIAQAISDLSEAARKMMSGRLNEKAIIILLQSMSGGVRRDDIRVILRNLQLMDREYLKPLPKKETTK